MTWSKQIISYQSLPSPHLTRSSLADWA